jgi:tetratricopeptide (TPR) repeat protein
MNNVHHAVRCAFGLFAFGLLLVCSQLGFAQPQPRVPITRQDDPLTRDPMRPNGYERASESRNAMIGKEVDIALQNGNEAYDSKPPRFADAEKAYLEAAKLNPKEARAYLGLGRVYAAQSRVDETITAFKKAIEVKPKLAEAHFNLALVYHAIGKKELAEEQYRALQPLDAELAKRLKEALAK